MLTFKSVEQPFQIGSHQFSSRLILGTGRYPTLELMRQCHEAAETQLVTVALRRVNVQADQSNSILDYIDSGKITLMPNTSGAYSAKEALRLADIAVAMGMYFLKIEVMGELKTLLPDPVETLHSVQMIREKYDRDKLLLLVYTSDDPVLALKLLDAGADAIMPAGSPIGSGRGLANPANLKIILELINNRVPIIVDAGIGCASDAAIAMELGADAVLLNTAVAQASDPVKMAVAMKYAVIAGRMSHLAGRMPQKLYATASSPL